MERSYFFNTPDGGAPVTYGAEDFARFHAQIIGNGVSNTATLDDLLVLSKVNMTVSLTAGYAFANGYMYENTAPLDLTCEVADPSLDRIDRVIIRFDNTPTERRTYAYIKPGTPATNPVPPALTRNTTIYELSVAQVRVVAGKSFIAAGSITDERTDDTVCGYIPLHNIYRGLAVSRDGIITLPNQSFVEARDTAPTYDLDGTNRIIPFGTVLTDNQNEAGTNTFKPKAAGVYLIWFLIRGDGRLNVGQADIQIHLVKNGVKYEFPFIAAVASTKADNMWVGSMVETLEPGDQIQLNGKVFTSGAVINVVDTWTRINKLS
ncbi:hypothetical protein [Bacillus sp. 7894-2]|uniref:hypothetical protein n=1 Tax=Bacillus sp. 7894-2 TaxID=2021695 RepID=UPI000BA528F4|nr:hypothetical protein [Bacillus sp. 7894-2]PAE24082.1 hypothetical protein CHI10_14870 [Bacillus sp. 7894-2]